MRDVANPVAMDDVGLPGAFRPAGRSRAFNSALVYLAVGLIAGAIVALQISIIRAFSVASWAHFGSFVLSFAMLGFGLASAVICVATPWFARHWRAISTTTLLLFGPLVVVSHYLAQTIPFNAVFLISDPGQKWRLAGTFLLYLLPFLDGAFFIGVIFLKAERSFNRVYFADLTGSGLCGLAAIFAAYLFAPQDILLFPICVWALGGMLWFAAVGNARTLLGFAAGGLATIAAYEVAPAVFNLSRLSVSDYKGISYARKFPDSRVVYQASSPFGQVDVFSSSYLHFAPGLSDNAAFAIKDFPKNAYLGLYVDGDGPSAVIKPLSGDQAEYFRFLPMYYPYLLKAQARTFIVQFAGGLSTNVALYGGASVTVAESNPAVLAAFRDDETLRSFTGKLLDRPDVRIIPYDGRIFLENTAERFDVVDLSLADSAGLSNAGGFAIVEKFAYTREAMAAYMRALAPDGVLVVTLWNKEEPPKSVLRLYVTMAEAARAVDDDAGAIESRFFVVSSYLSTTTVLYKRNGFSDDEIARLRTHTRAMSFDEIYGPGAEAPTDERLTQILGDLHRQFNMGAPAPQPPTEDVVSEFSALPSVDLGRAAWRALVAGRWSDFAKSYIFDISPLTNDRPYFAAYVRPADLPSALRQLDALQDEWGYFLLWATLGVACACAAVLIAIPIAFGWRNIFCHTPGKMRILLYFACLGVGYMTVEVGLVPKFVMALSNTTVSTAVLITGLLVFSGLGSLVSERVIPRTAQAMPIVFLAIFVILAGYASFLDAILDAIGALPYGVRLATCMALIFPASFLMGFPMPVAMSTLARLGKDRLFVWAWGINGCFSVIATSLVPIVASTWGLGEALLLAATAYLVAWPAFIGLQRVEPPIRLR